MDALAGFDRDEGNREKCRKHGVSVAEIEGLFRRPLTLRVDTAHLLAEERLRAIGRAHTGRFVFPVFTLRGKADGKTYVRPISARYMHKKEVESYEKENPGL